MAKAKAKRSSSQAKTSTAPTSQPSGLLDHYGLALAQQRIVEAILNRPDVPLEPLAVALKGLDTLRDTLNDIVDLERLEDLEAQLRESAERDGP